MPTDYLKPKEKKRKYGVPLHEQDVLSTEKPPKEVTRSPMRNDPNYPSDEYFGYLHCPWPNEICPN